MDENTVPEIIGFEEARSKGHVGRMYEDEGDDLDKLVFINADGSKTMYYFGFPVKYVDANGSIQDISLEIADSDVQIGGFRSTATAASTTFSTQFTDGISLTGDGADIRLVPVLPSSSTGMFAKAVNTSISSQHEAQRVDQNTISYYYDTDTTVEYSLTYTGFKEDIVVSEYTGQTTYPFRLYTNGLGLSKIDGSYHLVDDEGQIRATIGDIIIFTADERNNGVGDIVSTVIEENEEYLLTIVVDADHLADPDTTYPIRIDPTVEINYSGSGAGAIEDITISENTAYSGSHTSLYVGRRATDRVARALMRFPGLDLSGLEGATVTSATVSLRDLMCESDYLTVCCYAFAGAVWNASNATWDNADPDEFSPQLSRQTMSYSNGIEQPSVHWYDFDITSAVQGWIDGNYTQDKGLLFKATSAVESSSEINNRSLGSYNRSSYKPSLTVTYTPLYGTQLFANDTYYINNKHTGKYAKHTSSTLATTDSGLLSELGTGIQWKLQKVSAGYVIRRASAPDTYLGVPEDTTSNMIEMITIADAPLPESCVWTITVVSGGFRVQNNYNDRYLYHYSTVRPYTAITLGDTGTDLYDSRIWRIVSKTNYSDTSSTLFRELCSFSVGKMIINVGSTKKPAIGKSHSNAIWSNLSDFSFAYVSGTTDLVTIDAMTNEFTASKVGIATYMATHKPTNKQYLFKVYVDRYTYELTNEFGFEDSDALLIRALYSKVDAAYPEDNAKERAWRCARLLGDIVYGNISEFESFKWDNVAGDLPFEDMQTYFTDTLGYSTEEYKQIVKAVEKNYDDTDIADFAHFQIALSARMAYDLELDGVISNIYLLNSDEYVSYMAGWLGDATWGSPTSFGNDDYHADLDAENIYRLIVGGKRSIDAINEYYDGLSSLNTRAVIFMTYIDYDTVKAMIEKKLNLTVSDIQEDFPDTYDFMCSLRDGKQDINDY